MSKGDPLGQGTSTGAQTKVFYAMDGGGQNSAYDTLAAAQKVFLALPKPTADQKITWKKAIDAFVQTASSATKLGEASELGDQSQSANTSEYAVYGESERRKRSAPASVDDWTCAVAIDRNSFENHRELMDANTGDKVAFVLLTQTSGTNAETAATDDTANDLRQYTYDLIFGDIAARSTSRAVEEVATLTVTVAPNPAPFYQDNVEHT